MSRLADCPECGALGAVDCDANGFAVCCQCGLMVTVTASTAKPAGSTPASAGKTTNKTRLQKSQKRPILVASPMRQVAAAAGGGGSQLVDGEHVVHAGDAPNLAHSTGVFQSALMPNRPLHATARGRSAQAQGSIGKVPGNLRGSRPGHRSWMAISGFVHSIVSRLSLPHAVETTVFAVVRDFLGPSVRATQRTRFIVGAAAYYVARYRNEPLTLVDVADALGVEAFRVGKYFGKLCRFRRSQLGAGGSVGDSDDDEGDDDMELVEEAEDEDLRFRVGRLSDSVELGEEDDAVHAETDDAALVPLDGAASATTAGSAVETASPLFAMGLPIVDPSMLVPRAVNALWEFVEMQQLQRNSATTSSSSARKPVALEPSLALDDISVLGRDRYDQSTSSASVIHAHPWMANCPYTSKRELSDAAMRIVAIGKRGWVSSGRRPAGVAVAAVALAARFPIQSWSPRVSYRVGQHQVHRKLGKEQFDSLNWLAGRLLVGCTTAQERFVELRQDLLQCCQRLLPWGDAVTPSNFNEHLPDLIVFETTRHLLDSREKAEEREKSEVDGALLGASSVEKGKLPSVRDSRTAPSISEPAQAISEPARSPAMQRITRPVDDGIELNAKSTEISSDVELQPPRSFKRSAQALSSRLELVARARKRARGEEDGKPLDTVDETLDKLVAAGASNELLNDVSFQVANAAAVQHALAALLPGERAQETADETDSQVLSLDTVLTDSELSEFFRPSDEVAVLRQVWNSRNLSLAKKSNEDIPA